MIDSAFVEQPTDTHVRLRQELLEGGAVLPPPPWRAVRARAADFPGADVEGLLRGLRRSGLLIVELDEPLSNDRFTSFGALLGTAMPETDRAVLPYVEGEVILNVVSEHGHTPDVSLQPFAANYLTLHSESSGRRVEEQPRYIVLMCHEPGDDATAAQTVLVPMSAVAERLTAGELAILSRTSYRRNRHGPAIVRRVGGRSVFSFRDFTSQTLEWTFDGDGPGADEVNACIRSLLASMYAPRAAGGVHWTRGMIVVIDNTFFFHGRTVAPTSTAVRRRHLKRLRIL